MIVDVQFRSAALLIGRLLNLISAEDRRLLEKEAEKTMGILYHPTLSTDIIVPVSLDDTY